MGRGGYDLSLERNSVLEWEDCNRTNRQLEKEQHEKEQARVAEETKRAARKAASDLRVARKAAEKKREKDARIKPSKASTALRTLASKPETEQQSSDHDETK